MGYTVSNFLSLSTFFISIILVFTVYTHAICAISTFEAI